MTDPWPSFGLSIFDTGPNQTKSMNRIICSLGIGIEAGISILSWKLVEWITPKLFGEFISGWFCGGCLVLCVKDRIWSVHPSTPGAQTRGKFWRIVPFPTMINRYNFWVGFITENLCAMSAVVVAHLVWHFLVSSQGAIVFGYAVTMTIFLDRPFELNPPLLPPATPKILKGIMWRFIGICLQIGAHKLLAYASTPAKRRRRSRRTTKEHLPFPKVFPVDILRLILDTILDEIWEETDKMRDPEFSDVLSLMLTCKSFKGWVSPQFYQYVHVANPTRVGQLASCLALAIDPGDLRRRFGVIRNGTELADAYITTGPRIRSLSLVDYTWTLNEHLNAFTMLGRVLPHLRRLNIHWSLLHELRQKQMAFYAAQLTIVVDGQPPENLAEIVAPSLQTLPVTEDIGIRYAYPLDASGKVPLVHRRICSFVDPTFVYVNRGATNKIAMEVYLFDEEDAEQTKRSKGTLSVFLRLGNTFAALGRYTRIVIIVWVGDEEYESWVDPQGDGGFIEAGGVIQDIFDKVKQVGPGRTEGVVCCVPLRKRELSQWSFSVLERNGLDFWEEIEKRIAERAATQERGFPPRI